ncbi:hypothetical protein LPJ74_006797, partial [Coemansia sp. RSA 1843]
PGRRCFCSSRMRAPGVQLRQCRQGRHGLCVAGAHQQPAPSGCRAPRLAKLPSTQRQSSAAKVASVV